MFSSIPGLYLLEACHIPAPLPSCNNQRCLQKLTNVPEGGGRRGQHLPQLRATALSQRWYLPERGKRKEVGWERNQTSFPSIKVLTHPVIENRNCLREKSRHLDNPETTDLPEMARNRLSSGKQQKGRDGDQRREEASLCLWDPVMSSQGSTGPHPQEGVFAEVQCMRKNTSTLSPVSELRLLIVLNALT